MAKRIQRKRVKGWRMPEGTVYVGRPTKWGNPFGLIVPEHNSVRSLATVLDYFRKHLACRLREDPRFLEPLRGKDLACWCNTFLGKINDSTATLQRMTEYLEGAPCHADILLELTNG